MYSLRVPAVNDRISSWPLKTNQVMSRVIWPDPALPRCLRRISVEQRMVERSEASIPTIFTLEVRGPNGPLTKDTCQEGLDPILRSRDVFVESRLSKGWSSAARPAYPRFSLWRCEARMDPLQRTPARRDSIRSCAPEMSS